MAERVKITGTLIPASIVMDEQGTRVPGQRFSVELPLRDLFAAFALAGLISQSDRKMPTKTFAEEAYHCADSMLAQREEQPQ